MHLKMSSGKWRSLCLGLNVLIGMFDVLLWTLWYQMCSGRWLLWQSYKTVQVENPWGSFSVSGSYGDNYTCYRPIAQIPQCIRQVSHNAPSCNRNVHTFCYKMVHCGMWDWCNMGFVQQVYWSLVYQGPMNINWHLSRIFCVPAWSLTTGLYAYLMATAGWNIASE